MARLFQSEGARLVLCGVEAQSEPPAGLPDVALMRLDVQNAGEVSRTFADALATLGGRLDVLLHIAGISGRRFGDGPLDSCTEEGWDMVIDVNAKGVFLTNQAAVKIMLEQDLDEYGLRGSIVNVGSVLATHPSPRYFGTIAYAASKGAVASLTLAAASAYAHKRIRFNLLAPGLVDTPMAKRGLEDAEIAAYLATKQPLVSGAAKPEDCASAALFLCEPASRLVTGSMLNVDGGWSVCEGQDR